MTVSGGRGIAGAGHKIEHTVIFSQVLAAPVTLTPVISAASTNPAEGDEYVTPTQTLTFFSGGDTDLSKQYWVTTAANDDADNDVDQYSLSFTTSPSYWEISTSSGSLTVDEGSQVGFGVRIKGETTRPSGAAFLFANGTAESGDWTSSRATSVVCIAGVDKACDSTLIRLTANEDGDTDDETVVVSLEDLDAGPGGLPGTFELKRAATPLTITIRDNDLAVPGAPTGLTATAGNTQVTLGWTAPSGPISGWDYSRDNGATWSAIPGSGSSTTSYVVGGLTNDTQYTFKVRAKNRAGNGAASNSASATPRHVLPAIGVPDAPTGLTATAGDTRVTLAWTAPSGPIVAFDYSQDDGNSWAPVPGGGGATSHTVSGLVNDTLYTFRVRARNRAGSGAPSAPAAATPRAGAPGGAPDERTVPALPAAALGLLGALLSAAGVRALRRRPV